MEIIVSAILAYLLSGISQVTRDLGSRPIDRPMWAVRPMLGKAFFVALTWPTSFVIEGRYSTGQIGRSIVFGGLGVVTQMVVLTAFIWGAYFLAGLVFDNLAFQLILAAVIAFIGSFLVLPLASLLMMPITLILAWPLDLLFPLRSEGQAKEIEWCRTCRHHRKINEYEDTMKGLWRETSIPRSDKLPCKIVLETSHVWESYYETEPKSRLLFPKDCPQYEPA
jgi:hypothetical protein